MSCGVGHRRSSDPELLWLWLWPVAIAPVGPLAWELPYAEGAAQEKAKRQKKTPRFPPHIPLCRTVTFPFLDQSLARKMGFPRWT